MTFKKPAWTRNLQKTQILYKNEPKISWSNITQKLLKKEEQNHIPTDNESTQERHVHKTDRNYNLLFYNMVKKGINNRRYEKTFNIIRKIHS